MADLRLLVTAVGGNFEDAFKAKYGVMAKAATRAMTQISELIIDEGQADIAGAGFSKRWSKSLKAKVYPEEKDSVNPAALIYSKIPYSGVFQDETTITGQPLWLPLKQTAKLKAQGGKKLTPKRFMKEVGKLQIIKVPGQPDLLAAPIIVNRTELAGTIANISLSALKQGTRKIGRGGSTVRRMVPLFHAVETTKSKKKFRIYEICKKWSGSFARFYFANLKDN